MQVAQLREALLKGTTGRIARQLGERGVEGDQHLEGGGRFALLVQIEARPERQFLAGQHPLAGSEERRQAPVCGRDTCAAPARARVDQLPRVGPLAVGHLFSGAVAQPRHERVGATDPVQAGVGR